jgi:hypothetical protein
MLTKMAACGDASRSSIAHSNACLTVASIEAHVHGLRSHATTPSAFASQTGYSPRQDLDFVPAPSQVVHQFDPIHLRQAGVEQRNLELSEAGRLESLARRSNAKHLIANVNKPANLSIALVRIVLDDE